MKKFISILDNPIFTTEIRRGLRNSRIFIIETIYLIILSFALYLVWIETTGYTYGSYYYNNDTGQSILVTLSIIQFILVAILCPSFTCGAISGEKERKTYDLLITSLLRPFDIASGKLCHSLAYCTVFILSSVPLAFISLFFGGVSPWQIGVVYFFIFLESLFFSLIGLYCSCRFQVSRSAMTCAYLIVFFIGIYSCYVIPFIIYYNQPVNIPFIFCELPLGIYAFLNLLLFGVLLFHSIINLLNTTKVRESPLSRILITLMVIFNAFGLTGFISKQLISSDIEDIFPIMAGFYGIIMGISLLMSPEFSADPPEKGLKYSIFTTLFYSNSQLCSFFIPSLIFIILFTFSSILIIYHPLLMSMYKQIFYSITLITLILFNISMGGRIISRYCNKKSYARGLLIIIILLISLMPLPFFFKDNTEICQDFWGFSFLEPIIGVVSIWYPQNDVKIFSINIANREVPLFYLSFISYVLVLLVLLICNKLIRPREKQ